MSNKKTSEAQKRATKKYREKNREKIKEMNKTYAKKYYSNEENRLKHNKKMLEYYYLKTK